MQARRELQYIRKNLDRYHRNIGENVLWAAYNFELSVVDDVYNEPGLRAYFAPVYVQTLWVNITEAGKRLDDERYDVRNHLTLAVSSEALRNAGIPDIFNDKIRIFDLFNYWDRAWSIIDYEVLGRLPQMDSSTIAVTAAEIDLPGDYPFESPMWALDTYSPPEQQALGLEMITPVAVNPVLNEPQTVARWAAPGPVQTVVSTEKVYMPAAGVIDYIRLSLGIAPTLGHQCVIDILKNGQSIFPNGGFPTLVSGLTTTIKVVPDIRQYVADDYFTASVTQAGGESITIDLVAVE